MDSENTKRVKPLSAFALGKSPTLPVGNPFSIFDPCSSFNLLSDKSPSIAELCKGSIIPLSTPPSISDWWKSSTNTGQSLFDLSKNPSLNLTAPSISEVLKLGSTTLALNNPTTQKTPFGLTTHPSLALNNLARAPSILDFANSAGTLVLPLTASGAFRLPGPGELSTLAPLLPASTFPGVLGHQANASMADLIKAANAIHAPWMHDGNPLHSLMGFANLTTLGKALHTLHPFQSKLTNLMRSELGDWRKTLDLGTIDLLDSFSRSALYVDRGLNLDLVHFPRGAFVETMGITGLADNMPEPELSAEELALQRNNKAHDRLQRFEVRVRSFIAKQMETVFGGNWVKRQVPPDVYNDWKEKSERDRDHGATVRPLIDYADFTHYVKIITRKDNWDKVFKPHFHRQESVTESFQRLYPIRICTMHARPITTDDELYLWAETIRVLKVIG